MPELYIFSQDDKLLTILSESTGLITAPFKEELKAGSSFSFTAEAHAEYEQSYDSARNLTQVAGSYVGTMETESTERRNVSPAQFVVEENQVVFRDHEGDLRLYVIKEVDDIDNIDGAETTATCEPAFMELRENIIEDRRFFDQTQDKALNAALDGTRWTGKIEVDLFTGTTNFYYIDSVEALEKIIDTWGGELKEVVEFDDKNNIKSRQIIIKQRLGGDNGLRFDIDHNTEEIQRTVLSYPLTAMYGRGSSLEIQDDEGELTGGHTRYIDFADVEWKVSKGDPVDKPLGQKWVGDPAALEKYGRLHNGSLLHREGIFSNQDYEEPEELLQATWDALQEAQKVEVNYHLKIYLMDKTVSLGDTAQAIDRHFARPIEIQSRIISLSYDLMDIEGTLEGEMGQFLSAHTDDPIRDLEQTIEDNRGRWDQADKPISKHKYPDIKPNRPINVRAEGGFKVIQLYWDYTDEIYVRYYEVYGSQVKDFVPDSQHLLWKGDVSAFAHEVETDQTWYYYIRAVNYHDRGSDYSERVQASSIRVISDDILFGEDYAEKLRDLSKVSQILADGTLTFPQMSEQAKQMIGGINIVPHIPSKWEMGSYWSATGSENNTTGRIRTRTTKRELSPETTYTLSDHSLELVNVYIYIWDKDMNFSRSMNIGFSETEDRFFTFTTDENEIYYALSVWNEDETLEVDDIGDIIFIQLEKGDVPTDWTQHIGDVRVDQYALIENGIIGNAAIANAAIDKAHLRQAIIDDAHIDYLTGEKFIAHSIISDKLDVARLSSISADLGTVTAGIMQSKNNNMYLNLNTGEQFMQHANLTFGSGASINFESRGNTVTYRRYDENDGITRSSGLGVGLALGDIHPFAYLGTTGASNLDTLSQYFSGFIANSTARIANGTSANSITGYRLQFRNIAVNWTKGLEMDWNGNYPTIRPINGGSYNYRFGEPAHQFERVYAKEVRATSRVYIRDAYGSGGLLIATDWGGNGTSGTNLGIYGLNTGTYNYNIGRESAPFTYGYINSVYAQYLRGELQGSSAEKFKKNIMEMNINDSLEFVRNTKIKMFDWNETEEGDLSRKQVGFILDYLDVKNEYLVKSDNETIKKDNIIFMHQHVLQDNIKRLDEHDDKLSWLKTENQHLKNEIKKLKGAIA